MFDIMNNIEEQDEAENLRLGITRVLDWLYLGGEEDVCEVLKEVDVWIDFRHFSQWNRKIFLPEHVAYIRMPFKDGDLDKAKTIIPKAKALIDIFKEEGKKVLISCHAGMSRSAVLALWILAQEICDYDKAWLILSQLRPIEPDENFFDLLVDIKKSIKKGN